MGTFEARYDEVRKLMDKRRLDMAYDAARQLIRDFPRRAQAYFLFNLIICLTNRDGGARYSQHIIDDARRCPDFTSELGGDAQRDRAIGLARHHVGSDDLSLAIRLIDDVRQLHEEDPDRMACLLDVEGRVAYACEDYSRAVALHEQADQSWKAIDEEANPIWVYNNYVHWLKAIVAAHGVRNPAAKQVAHAIKTRCPEGSRNRGNEARVIMLPFIGNQLHDLVTRHR